MRGRYVYLCEACENEYGVIPGQAIRCPQCKSKERVERDTPVSATFCEWAPDDEGNWDTQCGDKHGFIADGPKENTYHFYLFYHLFGGFDRASIYNWSRNKILYPKSYF